MAHQADNTGSGWFLHSSSFSPALRDADAVSLITAFMPPFSLIQLSDPAAAPCRPGPEPFSLDPQWMRAKWLVAYMMPDWLRVRRDFKF